MDSQKDQNPPKEMEKYGVACSCAKGEKPPETELEKTADRSVMKCRCCGRYWNQDPYWGKDPQ